MGLTLNSSCTKSEKECVRSIPVMKDCVKDGVKTYVVDTEVVAYDRDSGNLLPFQVNNGVVYLDYEDSHHHGPLLCSFQ